MKILTETPDVVVVETAKQQRKHAEKHEDKSSPFRWVEADCYAALYERGWTQQRIADECGVRQQAVSMFVRMAQHYRLPGKRPSFWWAYQEFDGKTAAQNIVASNENEWYTPRKYVEAARKVLGGIDLDPASSRRANKTIKATKFFCIDDDGLQQPWSGRVWLNPPYGRLAGEFVRRLILEWQGGVVDSAIVLVNAHCTDTDWFQGMWDGVLCFTDHRIDFNSNGREKKTTSTHGSVFGYYGQAGDKFKAEFSKFGEIARRA